MTFLLAWVMLGAWFCFLSFKPVARRGQQWQPSLAGIFSLWAWLLDGERRKTGIFVHIRWWILKERRELQFWLAGSFPFRS